MAELLNLRRFMDKHGVTMRQLARALGRSNNGLFNSIDRANPTPELQQDVAIVFGDAGIKLPRNLWVDSDGTDHAYTRRPLRSLHSGDVISAPQYSSLAKARIAQRRINAHQLTPTKDKPMQPLSITARRRFGLHSDPFRAELHSVDDVFETLEHRTAVAEMLNAAKRQDFIAIIGEVGSGKTTCLEVFLKTLPRNTHVIKAHTLDKHQLTGNNLYDAIIMDIAGELDQKTSVPTQRERKARKVIALLEALEKQDIYAVLILDEAHALNKDCLRALKRLHELDRGFKRLLGIILIGQRELIPKLNDPTLREVSQRCARFEFRGLGKNTAKYIEHKIANAGGKIGSIFEPRALEEIVKVLSSKQGRITYGPYALQVNTFCTAAINLADELDEPLITTAIIDQIKPYSPTH